MFNELAKEAHKISKEHGWWDKEPTFGSLIALMHSELSEALEECRNGRPMVWKECYAKDPDDDKTLWCGAPGTDKCYSILKDKKCEYRGAKPEGIAVELADCIIRILDWAGHEGVKVDFIIKTLEKNRYKESEIDDDFGDFISVCHSVLSNAYAQEDELGRSMCLCMEIVYIMDWATKEGVDMYAIIREKMDYNKTRPYRHGGKAL